MGKPVKCTVVSTTQTQDGNWLVVARKDGTKISVTWSSPSKPVIGSHHTRLI